MVQERYNIRNAITGEVLHANLSEDEYFDKMEDYALEFYNSGEPRPEILATEMIKGD